MGEHECIPLFISSFTIAVLALLIISMSSPADDAKMRNTVCLNSLLSGISKEKAAEISRTKGKGDLDSLRWSIGGSAISWGLLTIPAALWIPPRSFSFRRGGFLIHFSRSK
ncbi:hypothetical protein KEM48_013150 [Puccinia striiformis f. sp. tritici PST-130]|nr:hypothetical protein KEM48_013150 [Puccinia striiformis f. sp. tritici PST-130]